MQPVTCFSFGYEGWGPHTPDLVAAFDQVEAERGYGPPLIVDVRVRREVRAVGFRGNALGELIGDRYRWLKGLGNRSIVTGERGIKIADPREAETLLRLVEEAEREGRRVIFFCSCGPVHVCHRHEVGTLLLEAAARANRPVEVVEWPGGEPQAFDVPVSKELLAKVARGRRWVPVGPDFARHLGTPWFSTAVLRAGEQVLPILTGPAARHDGWAIPVLDRAEPGEAPEALAATAAAHRQELDFESRHAQPQGAARSKVHPYCVYHIRHSRVLGELAARPGGCGELVEKGDWSRAAVLLRQARARNERLLMVFDQAEVFLGVHWVAELVDLQAAPLPSGKFVTTLHLEGLRQLPRPAWFPRTNLRLKSTGKPLAPGYLRGQLLCHTPAFLLSGSEA